MTEVKAALPPLLTISLFADVHITVNDQPVPPWSRTKARALLAYLALASAQPVARTTLCDLLWPGYAAHTARMSLRRALADLRTYLAPFDPIHSDYQTVQLALDTVAVWCDVLHFEQLLDECQRHPHRTITGCPACQARLRLAHSLYKAGFLATLPSVDSPPFNAWVQAERSRLAVRYAALQHVLCNAVPPLGNLPLPQTSLVGRTAELAHLGAYLTHPGTRGLTLVGFGGMGKTRLALALAEQVREHFPDGVWLVELGALPPAAMPPGVADRSAPAPDRLTQERHWLHDRLATAISLALGVALQGANRPTAQLTAYLRDKTTLLLLDTFEHLCPAVDLLQTLLQDAPRLRFLITSRHQIDLPVCPVYPVEGLSLPPSTPVHALSPRATVAHYSALQLFVERAENAAFDLTLDESTLAAICDLCRLVESAPLAIELAAALLETQSPAQILQAVRAHYTALQANLIDLPSRQRSAEALFRTVWALLTADEAQLLARCAVFRGGFTLDAAQTVAAATPALLQALGQKSLLRQGSGARYAMHDLVRQFADEQLAQDAAVAHQIHAAHAAYFTALLATWQPDDATEQRFRTAVTQEWENVQAAWAWALATGQVGLLQQGVAGLAEFYEMAGLFGEFNRTFGTALARVRVLVDASQTTAQGPLTNLMAVQTLLAHLLWRRSHMLVGALGELEETQALAEELLAWGRRLGNDRLAAWGYYELSMVALSQGNYQRQAVLLRQAIPLAQQQDDQHALALYLMLLGVSLKLQREFADAQRYFEAALAMAQTVGSSRRTILILNNLGAYHWEAGNFTQAIACFQQTLPRAQQTAQKDSATFATTCLGALASTLGDYDNARAYFEAAHQQYRELGDNVMEAELLNLLGALAFEMGELTVAADYCRRTQAAPAAQIYRIQREALLLQGHLQRSAGKWGAAHATYAAAYTLSHQTNLLTEWLPVQAHRSALYLAQGDASAALAAVAPVVANFADTSFNPAQRPQELLLIASQILAAHQDPRAPAVLQQAWALVQQQVANISDPRLRTTFLTNVPANRKLAQLVGE